MKILFLVEYFYPTYFGGSEVSAELFAKYLSKKCDVIVAAPNFERVDAEKERDGYKILRYPFPKHIVRHEALSQFWHNSVLLSFWRAWQIIKITHRTRIDVIHVQEKYLLLTGLIAKIFTGKPLIATVRDYQLLCPLGFCIKKERNYKACNLIEFFTQDVPYYFKNYKFIGGKSSIIQILFLVRARIIAWIYRLCLRACDGIVFISNKQKKIYAINGIKKGGVIYNIAEFNGVLDKKKAVDLLFTGKPSIGKGIRLLNQIQSINKKEKFGWRIKIIGGDNFTAPSKLAAEYARAAITIVPSFWEEPFGRVALESLAAGTPVAATNRGGLPEIVENKVTGLVSQYDSREMVGKINDLINKNDTYRKNIKERYELLKEKFLTKPVQQYIYLYQRLSAINRR